MKKKRLAFLIFSAASTITTTDVIAGESEWVMYAEEANGDVYFYDPSRVEKTDTLRHVWNGIQYKTSLMGAFSFLSLLEIDCLEQTEKSLQSTFFTDKHWERAAMMTDMTEKPKIQIKVGSTTDQLTKILCD